jgi:exonuclease III
MQTPEDKLFFVCSPCLYRNLLFYGEESFGDEIPDTFETSFDDDNFHLDEAIKNVKGFRIAHLNVNGILSKLPFIKILLHQTKLDIFSICETKINDTITDNDIKIDGYVCYRKDRNRNGGGVLLYVNENLDSRPLKHLQTENIESIWVKVCLKKSKPIYLCGVYRPPGGSDLLSTENLCTHFNDCFSKLPKQNETFILGDFNCNMLSKYALSSKIKELCSSSFLKQLIKEPTRVTKSSSTLIDLILTNSSCVSKSGVISIGISDHNLIYVVREFKRPKVNRKPSRFVVTRTLR